MKKRANKLKRQVGFIFFFFLLAFDSLRFKVWVFLFKTFNLLLLAVDDVYWELNLFIILAWETQSLFFETSFRLSESFMFDWWGKKEWRKLRKKNLSGTFVNRIILAITLEICWSQKDFFLCLFGVGGYWSEQADVSVLFDLNRHWQLHQH